MNRRNTAHHAVGILIPKLQLIRAFSPPTVKPDHCRSSKK